MDALHEKMKALEAYLRELELCRGKLAPAYTAADIVKNDARGLVSSILTVEDGVTLDGKIENVDDYFNKGVRMVALTWNYENPRTATRRSTPWA